ncbi:MAG: RelA/SpoT domain-containing protein [Longimicrobiales bacterium]
MIRRVPQVHSVRLRVKDPYHVCAKVVRKTSDERQIDESNYRQELSDLIGIRALHLLKSEWQPIHGFIMDKWAPEKPTAFIRKGDSAEWTDMLIDAGCEVKSHDRDYRSVHYDIAVSPTRDPVLVEIQVRTIFEEAWAELDHRINYPSPSAFPLVRVCISLFNRMAGQADEMASFVSNLEENLSEEKARREAEIAEFRRKIQDLKDDTGAKEALADQFNKIAIAGLVAPEQMSVVATSRDLRIDSITSGWTSFLPPSGLVFWSCSCGSANGGRELFCPRCGKQAPPVESSE